MPRYATHAGPHTELKYAASIGDGVNTEYVVTHNLGTLNVSVTVIENSTGQFVVPEIERIDSNSVRITFGFVPDLNAYQVLVLG